MTDEIEDDPNAGEYSLVMPFVLAASQGGPYEDTAFVAGWRLAELGTLLRIAEKFALDVPDQTLYPADEPQADLLAMRHGFTMKVKSYDEDWSIYNFTRNGVTSRAERDAEVVREVLEFCFTDPTLSWTYDEIAERLNGWADAIDGRGAEDD